MEPTFTDAENVVLSLSYGSLPKDLTKKEVELLERYIGKDWFEKLGYKDGEYERPKGV